MNDEILGITATRKGIRFAQAEAFKKIFLSILPTQLHHGACVGGDEDAVLCADQIWRDDKVAFPIIIVAHPGKSASDSGSERPNRSEISIANSNIVFPEKGYFARNRDIVNASTVMIAFPPCKPMPKSGGTTYTYNYAIKQGKPTWIAWPDGSYDFLEGGKITRRVE